MINPAKNATGSSHMQQENEDKSAVRGFLSYRPEKKARTDPVVNPLANLAKEVEEEKRKRNLRSRKLLFLGDVDGKLEQAFNLTASMDQKSGPFDALFCVGAFLPQAEFAEAAMSSQYLKKEKEARRDCYFIDTSPALVHAAPKGVTLGKNLHFLGAYGFREVCGLRVAFLSGRYNPTVYDTLDADFIGGSYTGIVVDKLKKLVLESKQGVDILLTAEWPASITNHVTEADQQPPEVPNGESWEVWCTPPISDLCRAIEPRYHLFGSANRFYQRLPFRTTQGHACRCIGLGSVGSPLNKQQKWVHALALAPMEHMNKEDLKKQAAGSTPCPLTEKLEVREPKAATCPPAKAELLEQCLKSLKDGDFEKYLELAKELEDRAFRCP